jgi:chromosome segregation ATPase
MAFDSQQEKDDAIEVREDELLGIEDEISMTMKNIAANTNELEESKKSLARLQAQRKRTEIALAKIKAAKVNLISESEGDEDE